MKESKFNFGRVLHVIWKHIWVVVVLTVIGAGATLALRPKGTVAHTATTQVMISPKQNYDVSNGTLMDMVKTYDVLGVAIKQYNSAIDSKKDKASFNDLSDSLQVTVNGNSRILTIKADEGSAHDVKKLANLIAKRVVIVATKKLPTLKNTIVTPARISGQNSGGLSAKKAIVLGGVVGFVVGIECTILLDRYQTRGTKKRRN
ncbi:YveK family protein [Lacticaseibacillus sp. GG6-2]